MQLESIILELMSRIQKLEDEVNVLNRRIDELLEKKNVNNGGASIKDEMKTAYKKMTGEMIEVCYRYGKRVHEGENLQEVADEVADKTGMNRNSAIMYLYVVDCLLSGTVYKRAINSKALDKYYEYIENEYGVDGVRKAVKATKEHIIYRKKLGHTVDSIEEICAAWEKKI